MTYAGEAGNLQRLVEVQKPGQQPAQECNKTNILVSSLWSMVNQIHFRRTFWIVEESLLMVFWEPFMYSGGDPQI